MRRDSPIQDNAIFRLSCLVAWIGRHLRRRGPSAGLPASDLGQTLRLHPLRSEVWFVTIQGDDLTSVQLIKRRKQREPRRKSGPRGEYHP